MEQLLTLRELHPEFICEKSLRVYFEHKGLVETGFGKELLERDRSPENKKLYRIRHYMDFSAN